MKKIIMKCFSSIANINKMDLYIVNIEMHFIYPKMHLIYLIHLYFVPYFGQRHFNALKSLLYIRNFAIGLLIIANKSMVT